MEFNTILPIPMHTIQSRWNRRVVGKYLEWYLTYDRAAENSRYPVLQPLPSRGTRLKSKTTIRAWINSSSIRDASV